MSWHQKNQELTSATLLVEMKLNLHTQTERGEGGGGTISPMRLTEPILPVKLMGWIGFSSTHSGLIH